MPPTGTEKAPDQVTSWPDTVGSPGPSVPVVDPEEYEKPAGRWSTTEVTAAAMVPELARVIV